MSQIYSVILITFLCFSATLGLAETDITKGKSDQQQLQSILQKLDQSTQQRQQQDKQLEALSGQLECNWALIRAYETCGQLHGNDPGGHLKCSATAKQNMAQCLEGDGEKQR
ncbi:MAG: hypothetical protein L3J84_09605 [Gammaproteobacteria bacterium]|nr:hypothetical protein [Gammaproteobacteria bacterium]